MNVENIKTLECLLNILLTDYFISQKQLISEFLLAAAELF